MKKLLLALAVLLGLVTPAFAACSTTLPAGSITIVDCNAESVVQNAPSFLVTDAAALPLGHWFSWSNSGTKLASGVPVSGQIGFSSGNSSLSWPSHGLTVGSYLTLTGTLPSNFTASTFATPVVYYVVGVPDANHLTLSATPGGSAITPNASATGIGYNLIAGFSAWADAVMNVAVVAQQQAATSTNVPAQIPVTPQQ